MNFLSSEPLTTLYTLKIKGDKFGRKIMKFYNVCFNNGFSSSVLCKKS